MAKAKALPKNSVSESFPQITTSPAQDPGYRVGRGRPPLSKKGENHGKGNRRTPRQLQMQEDVFLDSVMRGKSIRRIAEERGLSTSTVQAYLRIEEARRSEELAERRESEKARGVALYSELIALALSKSDRYDAILDEAKNGTLLNAPKFSDSAIADAIKARERIDKLLGLDAPTKVDLGVSELLDALSPQ